jgi:hypothetical protein
MWYSGGMYGDVIMEMCRSYRKTIIEARAKILRLLVAGGLLLGWSRCSVS